MLLRASSPHIKPTQCNMAGLACLMALRAPAALDPVEDGVVALAPVADGSGAGHEEALVPVPEQPHAPVRAARGVGSLVARVRANRLWRLRRRLVAAQQAVDDATARTVQQVRQCLDGLLLFRQPGDARCGSKRNLSRSLRIGAEAPPRSWAVGLPRGIPILRTPCPHYARPCVTHHLAPANPHRNEMSSGWATVLRIAFCDGVTSAAALSAIAFDGSVDPITIGRIRLRMAQAWVLQQGRRVFIAYWATGAVSSLGPLTPLQML